MRMRNQFAALSAIALLAACGSSEDAEEVSTAEVEAPVNPNVAATEAPDGSAVAAGSWDVGEDASGAQATFADASGTEVMSIRCNMEARTVTMSMAGAGDGEQAWRIDGAGEAARIDMTPSLTGDEAMVAEIEPSLAIFHAFAEPGQTVALTSPDGVKTYYPTHPGIDRVLYACS